MGASPQANQNLVNTMLAISRLQEVHDANITNQALRQETMKKRQQEVIKARDEGAETAYQRAFAVNTGDKPTPESEQFYPDVRPMFAPGYKGTVQVPPTGQTETTPMGFQIPVGLGAQTRGQVGPQQIAQAFQPGNLARRQQVETTAKLAGIPTEGPEGGAYQSVMAERKVPSLSDVFARQEALTKGRQGLATLKKTEVETRKGEAEARKEEVAADVAEATKQEAAGRIRSEAATAGSKAITAEVEARHAERLAQLTQEGKEIDNAIARGKYAMQPAEYDSLVTATEANRAKIRNLNFEFDQKRRELAAIGEIDKHLPGSPGRLQASQNLLVLQGRPDLAATLPGHMLELNNSATKQILEATHYMETAAAKDPSENGYNNAQATIDQINNMAIGQAGALGPDQPVVIRSVTPTKNWVTGNINGMTFGTAYVDPQLSRAYQDKTLEGVWRQKPGVALPWTDKATGTVTSMPPDVALSKWLHIRYSGLEGDTKSMTKMATESGAAPEVVSGAINLLQRQDPQIKNITKPAPEDAGAPKGVPLRGGVEGVPGSRPMAQLPPDVEKEIAGRGTTQSLKSAVMFAKDRIAIPKYRRPYVQLNATEKADIDKLYESRTSGSGRE